MKKPVLINPVITYENYKEPDDKRTWVTRKIKTVTHDCPVCGNTMKHKFSQKTHFCSPECLTKHRSKTASKVMRDYLGDLKQNNPKGFQLWRNRMKLRLRGQETRYQRFINNRVRDIIFSNENTH